MRFIFASRNEWVVSSLPDPIDLTASAAAHVEDLTASPAMPSSNPKRAKPAAHALDDDDDLVVVESRSRIVTRAALSDGDEILIDESRSTAARASASTAVAAAAPFVPVAAPVSAVSKPDVSSAPAALAAAAKPVGITCPICQDTCQAPSSTTWYASLHVCDFTEFCLF